MKLSNFHKINAASFSDFNWDSTVANFGNINILLGWNGTGKTVISRILRAFEHGENIDLPTDSQFTLTFDGNIHTQSQLGGFKDKVRVFNEDYIRLITGIGSLPHIFYLGEDAVDFSDKEIELTRLEGLKKQCINEHTVIAENTARNIKSLAGIATLNKELQNGKYGNYDKRSFEIRFDSIKQNYETRGHKEYILSDSDFQKFLNQISQQANKQREYDILNKIDTWIQENLSEINNLLENPVSFRSSDRISNYGEDSKEYSWIRDGVGIHHLNDPEHKLENCIFCLNKIENSEELIKHFTEAIIELNKNIDTYSKTILGHEISIENNVFHFYTKEAEKISTLLDSVKSSLKTKKGKPSNTDKFEASTSINLEEPEKESFDNLAHKLEAHYVAQDYERYDKKLTEHSLCTSQQKTLEDDIKTLKGELSELKAQAKNAHQPAEVLNKLIRVTFPYKEIELRDADDGVGYALHRNGSPCNFLTLSEGERNFIALGYFLTALNSVDETDSLIEDGIVVIDDPVSSLDKNSIFQIFSIISYEMKNNPKRQYFILTHNLEFFSHLHDHYQKQINEQTVLLYQVIINDTGSNISAVHELLKNFKSDYQYAISVLWNLKDICGIVDSYLVVNLLRRVWETFLHFKFSSTGDFRSMLDKGYTTAFNEKIQKMGDGVPQSRRDELTAEFRANQMAMYRFVNYGSHEFTGTDTVDPSLLLTASAQIQNFFNIVQIIDKHHFRKITS